MNPLLRLTFTGAFLLVALNACGANLEGSGSPGDDRSGFPDEEAADTDERFVSEEENQNDIEDGFTSNEDDVDAEFR